MLSLTRVFLLAALSLNTQDVLAARPPQISNELPDRYLVTLNKDVDLARHLESVNGMASETASIDGDRFSGVSHNYSIGNFHGYAGHFSPAIVHRLRVHDNVAAVEPDHLLEITTGTTKPGADTVVQKNAPYALNLLSHRKPQGRDYVYRRQAGEGTYAYPIGTGVMRTHQEFEKRVLPGFDIRSGRAGRGEDDIVPGTVMASVIGGKKFGVAKKCSIVPVQVVEQNQQITMANVLQGVEWAVKDILAKKRQAKAVIALGLEAHHGKVTAVANALSEAYDKGISVVIGAGFGDSTGSKPGKDAASGFRLARGVIVVAATDSNRRRAAFSNWGSKVTLFAPGVNVVAASTDGPSASLTWSGTDVAAGYVAGLVLYLKSIHALPDAKATTAKLVQLATKNAVGDPHGSPPLFAYNGATE
ncbi:hypothetical protein ANO11243_097500 [Dothideomycetidae sp. 11243]|nr:hypothetical protein ANO11243_097500 [fungal sp. No.11243]